MVAGVRATAAGALWPLSFLLFGPLFYGPLRLRRRGLARLPREGAVLVVCNHVSVADPIAVVLALWPRRRLRVMGKAELFRVPVLRAYMRGMGAFPIARDSADHGALRHARRLLTAGEAVCVFPEGRVAREGHMRPFGSGVGSLALAPGVRVVPVALWGTQRFRGPVRVQVGPPVDLSGLPDGPASARRRAATGRIRAALEALVPAAGGPAQAGEPVPEGG